MNAHTKNLLDRLAPNHLADLRKSGLSDDQIIACGFRTIRDPREVASILRWKSRADELGPCLMLPYRRADGTFIPPTEFARLKPDKPRLTEAENHAKYESPKGGGVRLYFPPATCAQLSDVSIPLHFTEGEKKAAKADQEGFVCAGLGGVWSWTKPRPKGPDGRKKGLRELHPDFDAIALAGRDIFIEFDSDLAENPKVQKAESAFGQCLIERGAFVRLVRLPNGPPDASGKPTKVGLDDFLVAHSADEFRALLRAAKPVRKPKREDGKVEIVISTNEVAVNEMVIQALEADSSLFQRGGSLVHIIAGAKGDGIQRPEDAPRIATLPLAALRERLTQFVQFVVVTGTKDKKVNKPVHPPEWCYQGINARGQWPGIPRLHGLVTAPVLKPDGTILDVPGYDAASGLLYQPDGQSYSIPQTPSLDDARKAVESIKRLVSDFPFAKSEHRSAFLAAFLTPLARFAFDGPSPLFLFDANTRGSGKSLLADLIALTVTGRVMPRMSNSDDDNEMRKRITSIAMAGDQLVLLDNIGSRSTLGCDSLDAALTGTSWRDRILGRSEKVDLPLFAIWYATGNNVSIGPDTARRVLHIRLDSPHERPETRQGFAVADIKKYVQQHRTEFLSAGLTILRAYFVAGCPKASLQNWGSFEGFSDVVRQAVVWCGEGDPAATREEFVETADTERNALRDLIHGWDAMDADCAGLTTSTILERVEKYSHSRRDDEDQDETLEQKEETKKRIAVHQSIREAILELCPAPAGKLPSSRSLGRKLRSLMGRVVNGRFIAGKENRNGSFEWRLSHVEMKPTFENRQLAFPEDDMRGLRGQDLDNPAHNPAGQSIVSTGVIDDAGFADSFFQP